MCEINPKHKAFFRLEAFTSNPGMTAEEFTQQVMERLLQVENQLNADGRFRFHIHGEHDLKGEPFDAELMAEIIAMTDQTLADTAGKIVYELATGFRAAGLPHIQALNQLLEEAIKRRIQAED